MTPNAAFIPSAPHFAVWSDKWTGSTQPPSVSELTGFNVYMLCFLMTQRGAVDRAQEWVRLDSTRRAQVIDEYHKAGISIMVSAFGSTDAPTTTGADPIQTANTMAEWVKTYGVDGIDINYEDFAAINSGTGSAEKWVISFVKRLRDQLPTDKFIISISPIAPWMTDDTSKYPHGAFNAIAKAVGYAVDWWNIQFFNQGSLYTTCETILHKSESQYPHTSIFEINNSTGIPLSKLLIGKPGSPEDAPSGGYMDPKELAKCLEQGKKEDWNGGAAIWEYLTAKGEFIRTVRSLSWPVGN